MQPELMNCPFCNGPAVNVAGEYISCGAPAFLTCAGRSVRADVEDWNTRATPTPPTEGRDADVEQLKQALEDVCNPLAYLKRMAEAEGAKLGGMAYSIANDIATVQGIARAALQALGERP